MSNKNKVEAKNFENTNENSEFVDLCGGDVLIIPEIEKNIKNKK